MTLSHETLERLLRKEEWKEARWISNELLAFIQDLERPTLYLLGANRMQRLQAPYAIGASLEPIGFSYVASRETIWALAKHPYKLVTWTLRDLSLEPKSYPLTGPATGLALDPKERWVSWFQKNAGGAYELHIMAGESPRATPMELPSGIPYCWSWNPQEDCALTLLTPLSFCPWHAAQLSLGFFQTTAQGPEFTHWEQLSPPLDSTVCLEAHWSPCGQKIWGLWQTGEWFQVWCYNRTTRLWQQFSEGQGERALARRRLDEHMLSYSQETEEILSLVQERGFFELQAIHSEKKTMDRLHWRDYTHLRNLASTPDGRRISVIGSSSRKAPTQIVLKSEAKTWKLHQQRSLLPPDSFSALTPEMLSWPSLDGELVYGFLYRDQKRKGPQALLMPIHGGPTEQVTATWPIKAQAFVAQGYAVLYVNYRGSWGFGKSYHEALAGHWGEIDVADIVSALLTLSATGWIDPQRVALWGGDIGASTVLHILQRYPKVFRAAILAYPLLELQDYWERTSPLKRAELDWALGTQDPEVRRQRSPMRGLELIQTPLAIFHGEADALVPKEQILRLTGSLESRKVPHWLTFYPGEAHSWQSRATLEDYYCKIASFLARFLRKTNT